MNSLNSDFSWTEIVNRHGRLTIVVVLIAVGMMVAIPLSVSPQQDKMCQLLSREFTPSSMTRIEMVFASQGLDNYEIRDSEVWVPQQERHQYLQAISKDPWILPDLQSDQGEGSELGMFMPRSQRDRIADSRKRDKLRAMIMQLPFVEDVQIQTDRAQAEQFLGQDRCTAVVMVSPVAARPLSMNQIKTIRKF